MPAALSTSPAPISSVTRALLGTAFHATHPQKLEVLRDALICMNEQGAITQVLTPQDALWADTCASHRTSGTLQELAPGQYLLPGFVDLHVHAPQWPQSGKALDVPLSVWLQDNTFPLEARYADSGFASAVYQSVVSTLLANGTTTALYFGTIHNSANLILAQTCLAQGQRALVGRVAMDNAEQCPAIYRDASAEEAIADTAQFIDDVRALPGNAAALVHPVITPRFIPSCTDELLQGLGALAQRTGAHVQTHCSESDWAHQYVLERTGTTDAQALFDFGLLTRRTVVAHANFLTDTDVALMARVGASVAHCPLSNFYFANSVFPARDGRKQQLGMGLGTDISGGYSPSMLDACRHAITASCALNDGVNPALPAQERGRTEAKIDHVFALWLATTAGGEALDLPIGQFKPGYAFDALVVDCNTADSNVVVWPDWDSDADVLQKIIYNATRANIAQTWVQGALVHQRGNAQ